MAQLIKHVKVGEAAPYTATGVTEVTGNVIDTQGYDGVIFTGQIYSFNAGNYAKVQQDTVVGMGGAADLAGSKAVTTVNGNYFVIDIYRPRERFLRLHVIRAGVTTILGSCVYMLYKGRKLPAAQAATTEVVALASPAEGTP